MNNHNIYSNFINWSDLVDDNGKLTKLGALVFTFVCIHCLQLGFKTFFKLVKDEKK